MAKHRFEYDLFVIGGGSGGVRAARVAAGELGLKVGLAEADRYGGTCIIRGCVPKKLMVFASEGAAAAENARSFGWTIEVGGFDWPTFRTKLHAEIDRLEAVYRRLLTAANVTTYDALAVLKDEHTVELSTGETLTANRILIATGGKPVVPDIPGAELGIVSADIFSLKSLPHRLLVVGGGYIACEFASIFRGLGSEVTQYCRGDEILRGFDGECRDFLAEQMANDGIEMQGGIEVTSLHRTSDGIKVVASGAPTEVYDQVLFALGRAANTDDLGLDRVGLELGNKGEIVVDRFSRTAKASIHAIGDVTDRVNLTPVAISEAMAFCETLKGNPTPANHDLVASVVFTSPEFASVGLTEEAARAFADVEVYRTTFKPMSDTFAAGPSKVLMKLVVNRASGKVLGCHIVAPKAGELIQLVAVAVAMGATKADFDRTVAVHPTMAEELVTMRKPQASIRANPPRSATA